MTADQKLRVLVIDDSRQIREFLTDYVLEPNGYLIDLAADGSLGLKKALSTDPDLILMDFEMPHLNGLEVLQRLRRQNSRVPVILMTSHGSEQIAVEVFRLGVQDYIIKPFTAEQMLEAIKNALSTTRLQREKEALTRRLIQTNQQLEQRVHELNVLYKIGKSITALTDPQTMLERIVDAVLFLADGDEATLVLVDPRTGQARRHVKKQRMSVKDRSKRASGVNTNLLVATATKEAHMVAVGTDNLLSVPLELGQKMVGTLSVTKERSKFTRYDEQLLNMLADYAAIAVHNLQLMRQLQISKDREKQRIRGLFERYVAPNVVEQIISRPDQVELGGKRQLVTVLFADVRGFSTFSPQLSPEILIELLNQYMRVAADAILAQQGTLDKFMGDAVMAFFNAPLSQPDHAFRATKAAWILHRKVEHLHQFLPPQHRLRFGVGVGVCEAVVGNIGTPQLMDYTVIGDNVNKVKRLQENARGGQILISQETFFLLQNSIFARSIGSIHLKGQSHPEAVYEILGVNGH